MILEVKNVTRAFGGLLALNEISFSIDEGEVVGIIGPNGAGKTTLFNVIGGTFPPTQGQILFRGRNITGLRPHVVCRLGIARTFQLVRPFSGMTALENVVAGIVFGRANGSGLVSAKAEAPTYLELVGLTGKAGIVASELTLADRKMLEIAVALSMKPRLLLLDEPMAGLNPVETASAMELVGSIRERLGVTVVWIEHVMKAIMRVAERVVVLHHGRKIADGPPSAVAQDPVVVEAYLGEEYLL